ncbi:SCO6745 family protein [Nonomuraea roseoviolacea]|uniref:SalK n=1 Tax=Nonomuraea roseoviolacea subsp. carminata TaxID=160689 RepID=A0ABT1K1V7_9ACTN|nr:hypothetical protein [Nonomuraea roseoviolacea]MCP2347845.1 hypothetical protein [Nonomuraea roseoviolacea subsp. carminata]
MKAARQAWRRLEPVHGMIYFAPEATRRYAALGLKGRAGYFASRGAALGRASAEQVIATFYNFCPDLVRRALPAAWDVVTPEDMLTARSDAAAEALRRAGLHELPHLDETVALASRAALAACEHLQGRPLFAAHAALPWPEEPIRRLWHAQTLLREFRGDGHIAALLTEGVGGLEALVLHGAAGEVPSAVLRVSRAWPDEEWAAAVDRLRERGLLGADETLSAEGAALRRHIEDRTDALALPAYGALGEDGCERLAELARPFGRAVVDAGLLDVGALRKAVD